MMNNITLEDALNKMGQAIQRYETCKLSLVADQSEILRDLSTSLYHLADFRVRFHEDWMSFYLHSKGKSEAAKEREADMKCPELYKIRQMMSAGQKVLESVRSTLSASKNEGSH
jgi:hypothetical protein